MDYDQVRGLMQIIRTKRRRYPSKLHTLQRFNMNDIAEAAVLSLSTLYRRTQSMNIDPRTLSLSDLVDFIVSIRK